jgi:hypothetical protein
MSPVRRPPGVLTLLLALFFLVPAASHAMRQWLGRSSDAENDAIRYSRTAPADAIARLQQSISAGSVRLQFDATRGYLTSVLRALNISTASQALVFSRTSFQRELISPSRPRALYFNRDVYVSWVQGGQVLEIASMDPNLGAVFYTLDQRQRTHPAFRRQTEACLRCHDTLSWTGGVPGLIMRSVHPDRQGEPLLAAGTFLTTDRSAFNQRWGGWYVTGTHGAQRHLGNVIAEYGADGLHADLNAGANLTDLRTRIDVRPYLTDQSDIVALMVLEHQNAVYNLMTRASYRTRMALYFDRVRNQDSGRSGDFVSDTTIGLVKSVAEPLVEAMLFAGETPLTAPVSGTSSFAREFERQGPASKAGRSLLELDLQRRLFRFPCSYLVYSPAFDALPSLVKDYAYRRLREVLTGEDTSDVFAHLSRGDRAAINEILVETKPAFAASMKRARP